MEGLVWLRISKGTQSTADLLLYHGVLVSDGVQQGEGQPCSDKVQPCSGPSAPWLSALTPPQPPCLAPASGVTHLAHLITSLMGTADLKPFSLMKTTPLLCTDHIPWPSPMVLPCRGIRVIQGAACRAADTGLRLWLSLS